MKPIGKTPGAVFVAATASTIEHDSTGKEIEADPVAAENAINKATYEKIHETDADPAVLEVLEALDDEAYIDEDDFEDDFVVKLDRQEARILAPMTIKKGKGDRNLDKDFEKMLQMYDGEVDIEDLSFDEEYEEVEEFYSEDDDASVDVVGLDEAKPFSRGGPSRMYQVDEVRRELRDGHAALLERILYTTDDDSDDRPDQIIELDVLNLHTKIMNCQNACEFLTAGTHKLNRPKLIREESSGSGVKPVRISRKTGMPIQEEEFKEEPPRKATFEEEPVNKGVPRNKEETAEEKRARKTAVKEERRERRVQKKINTMA